MQASPVRVAAIMLVAASALSGCLGQGLVAAPEAAPVALELTAEGSAGVLPDVPASASANLPAMTQTIQTTGVLWVGSNALTTQNGGLGAFDAGGGLAVGVAFGSESVKDFFEINYEMSNGHVIYGDTTGANAYGQVAQGIHRRVYFGLRRYLRPVTGQPGRVVPFVVGGVAYHDMRISGVGDQTLTGYIEASRLDDAMGLGVYLGTGIEIYAGSQFTVCFDARGSYWDWQGKPDGTGENGTMTASGALCYHF